MWILKYKYEDDVFYRITATKQPSKKSILFETPVAPPVSVKRISNSLNNIERTFKDVEQEENEGSKEKGKKARTMAASVIRSFMDR